MKLEFDYKRGQTVYLKNDTEQNEYLIRRVIFDFQKTLILELFTPTDDYIEVPESFINTEIDKTKLLGLDDEKEKEGD